MTTPAPPTATLAEFVLARIGEDELAAREATDGPWWYDPTKVNAVNRGEAVFAGKRGASAITVASTGQADDWQSMVDGFHIALHDPARVLAECEAKRRIVEWHGATHVCEDNMVFAEDEPQWDEDNPSPRPPCGVITILATVYADHPDYRQEWRP